ncbi:MAG: response regulator [Jaaginema sp. PMC 1079.18]|nr:response regulator [Jaaginema sp. PMC 1080.18]MEC4853350.1 response regulator [Jaaginema sp. PMC 1079.18]MEC4865089.1 response regulator [Jaaginema sp. PMC 1078.18]
MTWKIEEALSTTEKTWEQWAALGLALRSPNLALIISKPEELKAETSPGVYKNLANLLDGKRTLRDLAQLLKQDLTAVTRSLLPHLRRQFLSFVEVPDLPNPFLTAKNSTTQPRNSHIPERRQPPSKPAPGDNHKLIACIDDSPQILAIAKKVIESAGYDFLGIDDAVRALPTLLQHQPQVIFLDLVMPIANGYEICSQIRRISQFKDTPVVILTGKDGIVDRMRAKMVNATDFINKPVERQKILDVLQKYCPLSTSS